MATALAESAATLSDPVRSALRDLILVLADSKRLLGFRYGGWLLGAPEVETGIACAAMAQDEWGHARLLYALLKDFGDEVDALEHAREPAQYASMEVLDREPTEWAGLVALNAFVDTALSIQLEALRDCCYLPLRQRTGKILAEEQYHAAHGAAWVRRYARSTPAARSAFAAVTGTVLPPVLRWLDAADDALAGARVTDASGDDMRRRFLDRVSRLLEELSLTPDMQASPEGGTYDRRRRRLIDSAPDEETIIRIRGDRNRDFLVE